MSNYTATETNFWADEYVLSDADQQWFQDAADAAEADQWASRAAEAEAEEASEWQRFADFCEYRQEIEDGFED